MTENHTVAQSIEQYHHQKCHATFIKTFCEPHLHCCSLIWHLCDARDCIDRAVCTIKDKISNYHELLKRAKITCLYTGGLLKILMVVFLSTYPRYLKKVFLLRNPSYSSRGKSMLSLVIPRIKIYGLECIRHQDTKFVIRTV